MSNHPAESVWTDVGDAEIIEPEFLIKNLIPIGMTFMHGPPKSLKSAVELACALTASGVRHAALPLDLTECENPGRVLILSAEAQPGVIRHTAKHGFGVDIPPDKRILAMNDPWKWRLDQPNDVRELLDWADELDASLLCVDPLRNFHSQDENDSGAMVHMLQPLQQWAITRKKAILFVHHASKIRSEKDGGKRNADAADMRGTGAIFGLADGVITVTAKNKTGLLYFDVILKRGEAWDRTVQLGIWGQTAQESIDSETKMVYELLQTGLKVPQIAGAMKLTPTQVKTRMAELQRLGALNADGTSTPTGAVLVNAAVRKFNPKKG